jgi:hypothetical protein
MMPVEALIRYREDLIWHRAVRPVERMMTVEDLNRQRAIRPSECRSARHKGE